MLDDDNVEGLMARHNVPGVAVAVIHHNEYVWAQGYGSCAHGRVEPITTVDTFFQACSISKALTAVAALRLVEKGQLTLDDDVNRFMTGWQVPANRGWQPQITLRQLLSHTAGVSGPWFGGYHRDQQLPTLLQILSGDRPANTPAVTVNILPGSRFRYSGGGYCVIQQLLCEVTGETFPELMRRLVFDPVGMRNSSFEQPESDVHPAHVAIGHRADGMPVAGNWHLYPELAAAGLWTTVSDLAHFAIQLHFAESGKPNHLLSQKMMVTLLTPHAERGDGGQFGLGVSLDGDGQFLRYGHSGDNEGYACHWVSLRHHGNGAVILTNSDNGWAVIEELLAQIAQKCSWPSPETSNPTSQPSSYTDMADYEGEYQMLSGFRLSITQRGGELWLQPTGQSPLRLVTSSDAIFLVEGVDGEIHFLPNNTGVIDKLHLQQDGQISLARRVRA